MENNENKKWEAIFDIISKQKDFVFESISFFYIILYLLKHKRYELLENFKQNSNLAILKDGKRIYGQLQYDPIIIKNTKKISDFGSCPNQFIRIFESYLKNENSEYYSAFWDNYLIIYKVDKKIVLKIKQKIETKEKILSIIIFICTIVAWFFFIAYIYNFNKKKMFEREFTIIFVFGIVVSFFNIQYVKDIGTYEEEINKKNSLNDLALAIAGTSIGLSFILLFVQNFKNLDLFMRFILLSFVFCIASLIVPNVSKTSFSIHRSNIFQRSIINISITALLVGIIIYLHHSFKLHT